MKNKVYLSTTLILGLLLLSVTPGLAQGKIGFKTLPDSSTVVMSKLPFFETLGKVKQAISKENLMILDDIDGQAMIKMAGVNIPPIHQILFFHPRLMRELYEANKMATIVAPLKIIVMEKKGKTVIRFFKPSVLLRSYKGTRKVARQLDGIMNKIITFVQQQNIKK